MNVVDSSGWLEYFTNSANADFFSPVILNTAELIVPTISVYEVFKRVLRDSSEGGRAKYDCRHVERDCNATGY